jgi:hypothetical protein
MKFKTVAGRVLPLLYFLAVSLPHHPFSNWFDKSILDPWGHDAVQRLADFCSVAFLIVTAALAIRVARVHRRGAMKHFGVGLVLLALLYAADRTLIVNSIERVHFPQYAVLALLLGLSLRSEILIFLITTFAGFVDEFLQYVMEPMKTNYLDFNDIVFNLLGAAAGVVLLMGLRKPIPGTAAMTQYFKLSALRKGLKPLEILFEICGHALKDVATALTFLPDGLSRMFFREVRRTKAGRSGNGKNTPTPPRALATFPQAVNLSQYEIVFGRVFSFCMVVGALVVIVAGFLGRIVMLVEKVKDRSVLAVVDGKISFIMSFKRHDAFWIKSYYGKVFHVLSVGEGLVVIALLSAGMWAAVRWLKGKRSEGMW